MRTLGLFTVLLGFLVTAAFAEDTKRSDVLQTEQRIRKLERRQGDVERQLGQASRKINMLLKDLASNRLVAEGKGPEIDKMNRSLLKVKQDRVPKAADKLGDARTQIEKAYPHLNLAGEEISGIIVDLTDLLTANEAALIIDDLLRKIRELIQRETFLSRETKKWGVKLVFEREVAEADKPRVIRAQAQVVVELEQFKELLKEQVGKPNDDALSNRLINALEIAVNKKPELLLRNSIDLIDESLPEKAAEAKIEQDKAIKILKEIERALSEDDDDLSQKEEVLEELKRILEEQVNLKEEVEEAG